MTGQQVAQTQQTQTLLEPMHLCLGLLRQTLGRLCQRRGTAFAPINRRGREEGGRRGEEKKKQGDEKREEGEGERFRTLHFIWTLPTTCSTPSWQLQSPSTGLCSGLRQWGYEHSSAVGLHCLRERSAREGELVQVTATRRIPLSFITQLWSHMHFTRLLKIMKQSSLLTVLARFKSSKSEAGS